MGNLSPGPRRLCDLARGAYEPPPGAKAETRRALGVKLASAALATATAAAPKVVAASVAGAVAKLVIVSTAVVSVGAAFYYGARPTRTVPSVAVVRASADPPRAGPAASLATRESLPVPSGAPSAHGGAEPRARVAALPPVTEPAPSVAPGLEQETALLRVVHAALRSQQPARALALLNEREGEFRGGVLAPERAAARIIALCQLGRSEQARAEAVRFAATWPRSPLLPRVSSVCGGVAPTGS